MIFTAIGAGIAAVASTISAIGAAAAGAAAATGITAAGVTAVAAGAGAVAAGAGAYMNYAGAKKTAAAMKAQAAANDKALALQQQIEDKRQQAMNLDASRRKRALIRQAMQARAMALSTANAQGAANAGSSALPGAFAGIEGQMNFNGLGVAQNQSIGNDIFGLNRGVGAAYREAARAGSNTGATMSAAGAGLSSLGGAFLTNAGTIGRVGATVFGGSGGGEFLTRMQG